MAMSVPLRPPFRLPRALAFVIRIPRGMAPGTYPSRLGDKEIGPGGIVVPVIYDPERSVEESEMPITVGGLPDDDE